MAELKFSSTNVYTEDAAGRPVYDFRIFDAYKAAGVRTMVELGFMPGRHEPYQVHYPASTISGKSNNPPKEDEKWGELCRVVTAHLGERYGRAEVLSWYFEVWNEPDIDYWHAGPEDYWKLYDYGVAGVRAALPGARVGGPATTSPQSAKARLFLKNFLDHVDAGKSAADGGRVPMDFISFHAKRSPTFKDGTVTMGTSSNAFHSLALSQQTHAKTAEACVVYWSCLVCTRRHSAFFDLGDGIEGGRENCLD